MAQGVKCLPHEHKDWNMIHNIHVKAGHGGAFVTPLLKKEDRGFLELPSQPAWPDQKDSSHPTIRWRVHEMAHW